MAEKMKYLLTLSKKVINFLLFKILNYLYCLLINYKLGNTKFNVKARLHKILKLH